MHPKKQNHYRTWSNSELENANWLQKGLIESFFAYFKVVPELRKIAGYLGKGVDVNSQTNLIEYINKLALRRRIPEAKLTQQEMQRVWDMKHQVLSGYGGVALDTLYIKAWTKNANHQSTIILAHGLQSNKIHAAFHAVAFLRAGYNVFLYDQRNHGASGRTPVTMGYLEKFDLAIIIKHVRAMYQPSFLHLYGWSMGSFIILEMLKHFPDIKVNKIILDSPAEELTSVFRFTLEHYLKVNFYEYYGLVRMKTIEKAGYDPEAINPGFDLELLSDVSALFIVHTKDIVTPYKLGLKCYQNKVATEQGGHSELKVFQTGHVMGIYFYYEEYNQTILNFLNNKNQELSDAS